VHFKRTRYTGAHRGRHASETTTQAATNAAGAAGSTGTAATGTAATGTAATGTGTKATAAGTTTALASAPAVEKPGKKEKIRFGQAPREALPPAAHPTEQTAGTEATAGNEAQVASNSASTDIPGTETTAAAERKTRFSDRARQPKAKKAKTPDQVENERVAQQATPEEAAAEKTQSAPLGLAGDTATKKKAAKVKGEKTRYSDQANKSKQAAPPPPQTSTPSPLATPDTVPTTPADNAPASTGPTAAPAPTQPQR
jgi:peptidyl-prolyl cis-trans isomerase SurA